MTIFNSIRIRLTLWYLGILALIIIAFATATYFLVERNLNQTTDKNLSEMSKNVEEELQKEEADLAEESRMRNSATDEEDKEEMSEIPTIEEAIIEEVTDLKFSGYQFAVFRQNGEQIVSTVSDETLKNDLKNLPDSLFSDISGTNEFFRVYQKSLVLDGKQFRLFTTHSLREQSDFLNILKRIFYIAVPIALLLAGLGGYFLARQSLAPVLAMGKQAEIIGSGNLDKRLPIKNEADELGSLAKIFNALLTRLEDAFNQQQRFMADASHELRTPLTIIRTESEVALANKERNASEYRESLAIVHDESKRLTNIVEDLFLLSRADRGQVEPLLETVNLDEILTEAVRAVRSLAEKRDVKIHFSELAEMPLQADEMLLHRLFLNLLDNAIKYNKTGGTVTIDAKKVGEKYQILISDTGIGISTENQAKIFERFYRADEARGRDNDEHISGGAGLGLSIAAWIAEVHNGNLKLKKSDSEGSTFQLELPV